MLFALAAFVLLPRTVGFRAELVGPYFAVDAQINGKPVRLIVDTGAGMNVLTPEAAKRLRLEGGTPVTARGVGSEAVAARIVALDALVVEKSTPARHHAAVIPLPALLQADGLVGHGFLSRNVGRFNYAAKRLAFVPTEEFSPPQGAVSVPLRLRNNIPEVQLTVDGISGWVKVDTGASDNLTLFKSFVDSRNLRDKLDGIVPSPGSRGVGGSVSADQVRMKGLVLAGFELPAMTIALSKEAQGAFSDDVAIGNLGAGILRRFNFSLDYQRGKAYFQRGGLFESPELRDRSGLVLDFDANGHRVLLVRSASPAAAAGVGAGARLVAIDGVAVDRMPALEVWERLRGPAGTRLKLKLKDAAGGEFTHDLTLADF